MVSWFNGKLAPEKPLTLELLGAHLQPKEYEEMNCLVYTKLNEAISSEQNIFLN